MYVKKKMFLSGMGDGTPAPLPYPYPAPPAPAGGDTVANIIADLKSLFGSNTPPVPPYPGAPLPGMPGAPGVPYVPVSSGPDMTTILLIGGLAVGAYYLVKK